MTLFDKNYAMSPLQKSNPLHLHSMANNAFHRAVDLLAKFGMTETEARVFVASVASFTMADYAARQCGYDGPVVDEVST